MVGCLLIFAVGVPRQPHERSQQVPKRDQGSPKGGRTALETPRFADPEVLAHQQSKVVPGDVDQQPLGDVLLVAKVQPSHAAGLQDMGEGPLDDLASEAH